MELSEVWPVNWHGSTFYRPDSLPNQQQHESAEEGSPDNDITKSQSHYTESFFPRISDHLVVNYKQQKCNSSMKYLTGTSHKL